PARLASATHDAANRLTSRDGTSFTYDANGQLTGDGASTYTWDARSRLVALGGATPASFQYDAFGRRGRTTVAGAATAYLSDGLNAIQEQVGGTIAATRLTGLGVDATFARTDAAGLRTLLTDALGSTVGLVDSVGTLAAQYTYDPFGRSS